MAERVHPSNSPPPTASTQDAVVAVAPKPEKLLPPPGTYVIKLPKNQTYHVPPPENARRFEQYTRRKQRNSRHCRCLCYFIGIIFTLLILLTLIASILYLVFHPKASNYSIENINIKGINITSPSSKTTISPEFSPEFEITVKSVNPNNKIGIGYEKDSSAEIFYKDVLLCNGVLPAFYQPENNVTVFKTVLNGDGIVMRSEDRTALVVAESKRKVPLVVKLRAPVKVKVGSVKTWKITVKVDCVLTVDKLAENANIVGRDCDFGVNLF